MSETSPVARTYAESLFLVAEDRQEITEVGNHLSALAGPFGTVPQLRQAMLNPRFTSEEKFAAMHALDPKMGATLEGFLRVLLSRGRMENLPGIDAEYRRLLYAKTGMVDAEVFSAVSLTEQERSELERTLGRQFGKQVRLTERLQPSLIGGVRIRIGDSVLDRSLEQGLKRIKVKLLRMSLGEVGAT